MSFGREESAFAAKKNYSVYILASRGRVLYVGVTGFLMPRVLQHKTAELDGFTRRYHITRLVYYEVFHNVNHAIARETEIKKWRREKKVALIERSNPTGEDLAADWGTRIVQVKADSSPAKAGGMTRRLPLVIPPCSCHSDPGLSVGAGCASKSGDLAPCL